jgi:hypothetical protein
MVDDTHLAVLKQGVAAWTEWRAAHAAARPDFSSASLRGLDLAKVDFAEANLRKADLRGTTLSGAVLIAADLADANFFKAALKVPTFLPRISLVRGSSIARSSLPRRTGNRPSGIRTLPAAPPFLRFPTDRERRLAMDGCPACRPTTPGPEKFTIFGPYYLVA